MAARRGSGLLYLALVLGYVYDSPAVCLLVGSSPAMRPYGAPRAFSPGRASIPCMMAKKVTKIIKLAIDAGKASPAPPIGPALGAAGANIMMFCKEYNARTQDQMGTIIPVEISVYDDRSFTFITKTPPAAELIKKAAGVSKGSGTPHGRGAESVGSMTMAQVEEIAKVKLPDLNTNNVESAMRTVMGTARNMGVKVDGEAVDRNGQTNKAVKKNA